jgi:two-component sensor histidine kinase
MTFTTSADPRPSLPQSKARLYVLCQVAGWGFFWGFEWLYARAFDSNRLPLWAVWLIALLGLLITHCARPLLERWGWKKLDWGRLFPRLLAASVGLSVVWYALVFGLVHGVFSCPSSGSLSVWAMWLISILNSSMVMFGWLGLYFFYQLSERYRTAEIERWQLESALKETQLRALKSQINPHFIFNSLNSLRALVDENPARARQAVTQLANLLRYSLQAGQLETVPFADELRTVQDYLALEQVRHEERLQVRLDVAPDALDRPVPPLLLQTLVENAIKYGINPRPEGGEITISAHAGDGGLRIEVGNPGALAAANGAGSTGVGLKNAAERLRLIFGPGASLRLRAAPPGRVVAEAFIPPPPAPA